MCYQWKNCLFLSLDYNYKHKIPKCKKNDCTRDTNWAKALSVLMGIRFSGYAIEDQAEEQHVLSGLDHETFSVESFSLNII